MVKPAVGIIAGFSTICPSSPWQHFFLLSPTVLVLPDEFGRQAGRSSASNANEDREGGSLVLDPFLPFGKILAPFLLLCSICNMEVTCTERGKGQKEQFELDAHFCLSPFLISGLLLYHPEESFFWFLCLFVFFF